MQAICSRRCEIRAANLYALYRFRPEDFWSLWDAQGGICAMPKCETPLVYDRETKTRNQGHCVDHDHKTGTVRGLLCPPCNRNLGGYERIVELGAALYLGR